jgi:hypothetical protein
MAKLFGISKFGATRNTVQELPFIGSLNSLSVASQTFATGTSGTDFNISSSGSTHTFNIPNASSTNRGLVNTSTQTFFGSKAFQRPASNTPSVSNSNIHIRGSDQGYGLVVGTRSSSPAGVWLQTTVNDDVDFSILSIQPEDGIVSFGTDTPDIWNDLNAALFNPIYTSGYAVAGIGFGWSRLTNSANSRRARVFIDSSGNLRFQFLNDSAQTGTQDLQLLRDGNDASSFLFGGATEYLRGYVNGVFEHRRASGGSQSMTLFYNGGSLVGEIRSDTTSTQYLTSSDYRLKTEVSPIQNPFSIIQDLEAKQYKWINKDYSGGEEFSYGFLAHELKESVPEAATGEKDQTNEEDQPVYQMADVSKLVPILFACVKELKQENEELKERINILEENN